MAPDFTLPGAKGQPVKLSDFRGKKTVVLAFFPAAFTGGCTKEMTSFAADTTSSPGLKRKSSQSAPITLLRCLIGPRN
jgi:peroxiredoxin